MTIRYHRLALPAFVAACLSLAGCVSKPPTRPNTVTGTTTAAAGGPQDTIKTGIAACDDYLANYLVCHRAAAVFPPDQLQGRYETMRASLLQGAQDPRVRPQLGARCTAMAQQLTQMLHGKSCASVSPPTSPATGSSR